MAPWPPANTHTTCTAPPSALCLSTLMLRRVSSDLPVPHSALHPEAKGNGSSIYLSLARGERAVNRVDTRYLLTDGLLHQQMFHVSNEMLSRDASVRMWRGQRGDDGLLEPFHLFSKPPLIWGGRLFSEESTLRTRTLCLLFPGASSPASVQQNHLQSTNPFMAETLLHTSSV